MRAALDRLVARSRFLAALGLLGRLRSASGDLHGALGAVEVARRSLGAPSPSRC